MARPPKRNVFNLLSAGQIQQIDAAGREILTRVGFRVLDEKLRSRLKRSGVRVDSRNQRVFIPDAWLEARLSEAPGQVKLFSRGSDRAGGVGVGTRQSTVVAGAGLGCTRTTVWHRRGLIGGYR